MRMRNLQAHTSLALLLVAAGCNPDPGQPQETPNYRSVEEGEPSSGERGNLMITEVNWAGSVTDEGEWDPDDVFIEFQNRHPRPINPTGWRLIIEGDYINTHRIPEVTEPIQPNDFFVIAAKEDGAFGDVADVVMEELKLGKTYVHIELRDADRRLIEGAGSDSERAFTGGYDTYATRSMERVQLIFGNQGSQSRNWHAYSDNIGYESIREGWRQRTLASPGVANSEDYSGSGSAGGFE